MSRLSALSILAASAVHQRASAVHQRAATRGDGDRGDVPGWVMIVVMTAALVAALLAVVGPRLTSIFNNAVDAVSQ